MKRLIIPLLLVMILCLLLVLYVPVQQSKEFYYDNKARAKIAFVMREFEQGTLKTKNGKPVTSRKQALAIALSKARKHGYKVPSGYAKQKH